MLVNPFTPTQIAVLPDMFFGRDDEKRELESGLRVGSVLIQGPVGIGKSSLLAQMRMLMEGFASENKCESVVITCNKEIASADELAAHLLEQFLEVDESEEKITVNLGTIISFESTKITRYFKEKRHLNTLVSLLEHETLRAFDRMILAVDEADKCPIAVARLVRTAINQLEQKGIMNVRFVVAGVSPFFQRMLDEDAGLHRFFYKHDTLGPLEESEATSLLESKLQKVLETAHRDGLSLAIDPETIQRIVILSGCHPHLLQLLGSHLIEHENLNPDGCLDSRDLATAIRTICYNDRDAAYDVMLHNMEINGAYSAFKELLQHASRGLPTRINRLMAEELHDKSMLHWLVENNVLTRTSAEDYGLVDEFLRIRVMMDLDQERAGEIEKALIANDYSEETGELELMDYLLSHEHIQEVDARAIQDDLDEY